MSLKNEVKRAQAILALEAPRRYDFFLKKVADHSEVWGLYDEGWALAASGGKLYLALWPEAQFAQTNASGDWAKYVPKRMSLDEFADLAEAIVANCYGVSVFPVPAEKGILRDVRAVLADIAVEVAKIG